jgi:hypothetical protein
MDPFVDDAQLDHTPGANPPEMVIDVAKKLELIKTWPSPLPVCAPCVATTTDPSA